MGWESAFLRNTSLRRACKGFVSGNIAHELQACLLWHPRSDQSVQKSAGPVRALSTVWQPKYDFSDGLTCGLGMTCIWKTLRSDKVAKRWNSAKIFPRCNKSDILITAAPEGPCFCARLSLIFAFLKLKEGDPSLCNNIREKSIEKGESQEKIRDDVEVTVLAQGSNTENYEEY